MRILKIIMQFVLGGATLAVLFAGSARPQTWEVGASAGYGACRNTSMSGPSASGTAGFNSGFAFGVVAGNDMYRFVGGEARYTFRASDLSLAASGTKVKFEGEAHAVHYDFMFHGASRESKVRPFFAAGAGMKFYRGTGTEAAFQPLMNLAVLSHTSEVKPLVSAGGGVKIKISRRALVRFDFRDYTTPFPEKVIVPRNNVKLGGWLHDFVFLFGVSAFF